MTCQTTQKSRRLEVKKRKQKSEENKIKEGEMWNRSDELNSQFKKIRQSKKEEKKISAAVNKL